MEGIGRTVLVILSVATVSSCSGLEIGGSVSYDRLAGDFGRDYGGGVGFSAVLGTRLSPTHDVSIVACVSQFPGDGNEELSAWLRVVSLRFRLFPMEGKPYFVAYSLSLFNLRRSLSDRFEEASYPGLGLGGGVALPVTSQIRLSLAVSLSRVLAEAKSGSVVSIDAYFARHF